MKYIIDKSDLFIDNKLHPEGSVIDLTSEQSKGLEYYLIPISVEYDLVKVEETQKKLNTKGNKK